MGKNKFGIPDRWRDYSNYGRVIKGTRFIALKVPLNALLQRLLPDEEQFAISDVVQIQNLGHVIDLTFTDRYYKSHELEEAGVKHTKIKTMGHAIPHAKVVKRFYYVVDKYFQEEPEKIVGVHCTHGLNRTGYLVCRYMIEKLGFEPNDAINEFNSARGHEQERANYIQHLKSLKGGQKSNQGMALDNYVSQSLSFQMDQTSIGNSSEIDSEEMHLRESKKSNLVVFGLSALVPEEESLQLEEVLANLFETTGVKLRPKEDFEIIWKKPLFIRFANQDNRDCILQNSWKIKSIVEYKNISISPDLTRKQLEEEAELKEEVEKRNKLMKENNPEEAKHFVWKLAGLKGQRYMEKVQRNNLEIGPEEMHLRESKKSNLVVYGLSALVPEEESLQLEEVLANLFETTWVKLRPKKDFEIIRKKPLIIRFATQDNRDCILQNSWKLKKIVEYKNISISPDLTRKQLEEEAELKEEVEKRNKFMKENNPEEAKHFVWKLAGLKGQRYMEKVPRNKEAELKEEVEKRNKFMKENNPEEAKHFFWKLAGLKGQRYLEKVEERNQEEKKKFKENDEIQKSQE